MAIPKGKFIPVQAVRVNRNGTVDVKVSGATANKLANPKRRKKRNVAAGFFDEDGYFHPIRASYDYSPGRVGEKGAKKRATKKKAKTKRKR